MTAPARSGEAIREALGPDGALQLLVLEDEAPRPASFTLVAGDDGVWLLSGEVDFACASDLATALGEARGAPWVVDVSGLQFVDVAGMRAIAITAAGTDVVLELRRASRQLRRLWVIAGFDRSAPRVRLVP